MTGSLAGLTILPDLLPEFVVVPAFLIVVLLPLQESSVEMTAEAVGRSASPASNNSTAAAKRALVETHQQRIIFRVCMGASRRKGKTPVQFSTKDK